MLGGALDFASTSKSIVFVVFLLAGHITSATQPRVSYTVLEGQPVGTFVGDLHRDVNLTSGTTPTFVVRRRHRPSPLPFSMELRSGVVRTTAVLDREGLCPPVSDWGDSGLAEPDSDSQCLVSFEVVVRTTTSSHTIRVDVEVLDLNDNTPTFPGSEVTRLQIVKGRWWSKNARRDAPCPAPFQPHFFLRSSDLVGVWGMRHVKSQLETILLQLVMLTKLDFHITVFFIQQTAADEAPWEGTQRRIIS